VGGAKPWVRSGSKGEVAADAGHFRFGPNNGPSRAGSAKGDMTKVIRSHWTAGVVAMLLAGYPGVTSAQVNCEAIPYGPARTDCYLGISQFYRGQSDLAAARARAQSDAAWYRGNYRNRPSETRTTSATIKAQTIPARPAGGPEKLRSCDTYFRSRITLDNHNREDADDRSCVGSSSARRVFGSTTARRSGKHSRSGCPGGGKNGGQKHA
jgi:hypothetical protein